MTYAGIQMFIEKLNHLINCNNIPSINKPAIILESAQFQLLSQDLSSMIQTIFIDEHHDLHGQEKHNDLKQRFIYAAEEAQYIVDLFLSVVHIRNTRRSLKYVVYPFLSCVNINGHFRTYRGLKHTLNLDDVRRSLKSVEVEFMSMCIDSMKMDSPPTPPLNQFAAGLSSMTRNSLGSKKVSDEIFVGINRDAELIRNKLVEDKKKLDFVSIVGMGGIGKTTLATKVFNDGYVKHHFHVRAWVTVSQKYNKRAVLTQILISIPVQLDFEKANVSRLREIVHKNLMGMRYLIVIDDIWHIETWDNLITFFPHDNTRSRILLTSRLNEVAKHASSNGLIHHLGYLNKENSLELLCQKVFQGEECPKWSIKPGMQIVENCQGLPLAVVVIAGVLAKHAWSKKFWKEISFKTGSYLVGNQNGFMETLALSYNHLPLHLRECFLYLGGFPEDYLFKVQRLIWLWVAEGFIQQDGNRSLEDIAEGYLMNLIDRNLVIVTDVTNSNGGVKAFKVHDLVRELCLRKAKEERFILMTEFSPQFSDLITQPFKPVRMFINKDIDILPSQNLRSIIFSRGFRSLKAFIANGFPSFELLRVLDLHKWLIQVDLPKGVELLVHLRYLAIWKESEGFPSSICNLWNLQTLIYITRQQEMIVLPSNISDLVNLRHLWTYRSKVPFVLPSIKKPMNLQTISGVELRDGVDNFQKCFPYIKELTCTTYKRMQNDFRSLTYLEKLKLMGLYGRVENIKFPATLKTLELVKSRLLWSDMETIQSLPNLQVLKLKYVNFEKSYWDTDGQEFQQLQFLRLQSLNIKHWVTCSASFPCLKRLEIFDCLDLEEIPLEIGEIPTLELIKIKYCSRSLAESVRRIQEEQHDFGNYDLKIHII